MGWDKLKKVFRYSFFHPRYLANRELSKIISLEGSILHGNLLDVGCGRKPYAHLLPNVNSYIGLDVPSTMHSLSQVDVIGTSLALPFQNESFDSILCTEVLEHTPDPLMALCEMWRVTKAEEVLLLTAPLSEQLHEEPYDYYRFTRYGLNYLLRKSGWKILKVYERGGTWLELGYRLSSFLYSSIGAKRNADGALDPRFFLGPLILTVCAGLQFMALVLDTVWRFRLSTIGYGIIAQKEVLK
jgi:SAM-dependent methyltransferase